MNHFERFDRLLTAPWLKRLGGSARRLEPLRRVPRVSVVIPCYNYGRYLTACVDSALHGQDGVEVEIIIVDDKSTDDSLAIAQDIASRYDCVTVLAHAVNRGAITTYNDGLAATTGEYVTLLSADDLLTPGSLPRAAMVLQAEPSVGMVYGAACTFSTEPPVARAGDGSWILWPGRQWLQLRCLSGYNVIASPEVVMRRTLVDAIGLYRPDLPHAGDFELWLRTAAVADIGFVVGADQAFYRQHAQNMHKVDFRSGSHAGALIDLEQRRQSFETVFSGVGQVLAGRQQLLATARRSIARNAVNTINYAFARGWHDFPVAEYERFAHAADPGLPGTGHGRALARRKRLGMQTWPLHPLWTLPAVGLRLTELARRWRRWRFGV